MAHSNATQEANSQDMSLAEKKAVIMRKLQMVKDKMDAIKSNAF